MKGLRSCFTAAGKTEDVKVIDKDENCVELPRFSFRFVVGTLMLWLRLEFRDAASIRIISVVYLSMQPIVSADCKTAGIDQLCPNLNLSSMSATTSCFLKKLKCLSF